LPRRLSAPRFLFGGVLQFVDNCNNTFAPAKGGSPCFDMVKKGKGGNVGKKYGGTCACKRP
jgi:hypothetical protein